MKKLICLMGCLTSLVACGGFKSANSSSEKKIFLASTHVFSMTVKEAVAEAEEGAVPPPPPPPSDVTEGTVPVLSLCTDMGSGNNGGVNLKNLTNPEVVISQAGAEVCRFDGQKTKDVLLNMKRISLSDLKKSCPTVTTGEYTVNLESKTTKKAVLFHGTAVQGMYGGHKGLKFNVTKEANGSLTISRIDTNDDQHGGGGWLSDLFSAATSLGGIGNGMKNIDRVLYAVNSGGPIEPVGSGTDAVECDVNWSPLLIQLSDTRSSKQIKFSPISKGVLFDILGDNATPAPHTKKPISWFTDLDSATYNQWLVRPNGMNQTVDGINDMFGDNTRGPDGKFAANGFEALRKFDNNHDGKIDHNDRVFFELSLWADRNRDGVAGYYELTPLDRAGIEYLDLGYDPSFKETDLFGNEIRYKSVARMKNGQLNLIYDVWFRMLE